MMRRRLGAVLACVLLGALALPAHAAFDCDSAARAKPLNAQLIGTGDARALVLSGGLRSEDSADSKRGSFADVQSALARGGYAEVWLCSGGGSVQEGYKLGRYFARRRLKVRVPDGFTCASACTIATMGGYLRTIDTKASFIVHASSGVSGFSEDATFYFECGDASSSVSVAVRQDCNAMAAALENFSGDRCDAVSEFGRQPRTCRYIYRSSSAGVEEVLIRGSMLYKVSGIPEFVEGFANSMARNELPRLIEMVQYYQLMLNDNNAGAVRGYAYQQAIRAYDWRRISDRESHLYGDLRRHQARLSETTADKERGVIWQDLLTDIEIGQQQAVVELLRENEADLGRGAKQALNIMDTMIICRIQSACYLDRNALARLGYHNFDLD
ncbi:MAG: hypothetical protein AAFY69_01180 [Pseudomonadota bacterium]